MPLDPQFTEIIAMMRAMPPLYEVPLELIRNAPVPEIPDPTPVDEVSEQTIPGPGGNIKLRIYRSGQGSSLPIILFMHGGGMVVGGLDTHDEAARALTAETGCVTVSVEYRLAPEHPFPAAPDDCFAALKWVAANAGTIGGDAGRIAVVGDSAGGNLASVMALRARDEGGRALRGQVLIYPATDLLGPFPPAPDGEYYIINPRDIDFFNGCYLSKPTDGENPHASPAKADNLQGLPPALVVTAEYDPLCGQGEAYADRLKQAGVDTTLIRYDGAIHGFVTFPTPMGRQAVRQVAEWLNGRFS